MPVTGGQKVDREQDWATLYNAIGGRDPLYSALKRIEAELEQAERERDEARKTLLELVVAVGQGRAGADLAADVLARLEKVPALVEAGTCRRFTVSPCRERPEIPESEWCAWCTALTAWESE